MNIVENPTLPFFTRTDKTTILKGTEFRVIGKVRFNNNKNSGHLFAIELMSLPFAVLNLKFNFDTSKIVLNTRTIDWQKDHNPLKDGENFDLQILVHDTHYDIKLNGKLLTTYKHRYPYKNIHWISGDGEMTVDKVIVDTPEECHTTSGCTKQSNNNNEHCSDDDSEPCNDNHKKHCNDDDDDIDYECLVALFVEILRYVFCQPEPENTT